MTEPLLVRPLRVLPPIGQPSLEGVREITTADPRITRLWERFSVDIDVAGATARDTAFIRRRVFEQPERGYRVLIIEDGDRYAIRAMCIFTSTGYVMELLHDRSVFGMRAASRLLAIAIREMRKAGARSARAWSLPHSGSFPVYLRHVFLPMPMRLRNGEASIPVNAEKAHSYVSYLDATDV